MRTNKKQQYINGLNYDAEHLRKEIAGKKFLVWWHGDLLAKPTLRKMLAETEEELTKVNDDKNYKPWKD